ncbi:ABC transporter permease [Priestia taiwanensis]|uniref:ABC transporter permease n=1 Tax=Priestia taiwanensis TaxID=1347902 RepID=A0A917AV87_9BACI|nr:ABC transporter permease [Priestia taiwanensis]MBM7364240.1 ABC-2 type transport system permease protein [Priestia taiwanensis]GGE72812.1 ABC transporter permease [Priestia taiwanensis]
MDVRSYWKTRFKLFVQEIQKYMKYMLNDHLKFVLIFAIGGGAFYYQRWLETLPPTFPAAFIIAAVMALVLTNGTIITFLKEADAVFFLPLEERLKGYFARSFFFTYQLHIYFVVAMFGLFIPLYAKQMNGTMNSVFLLLFILVLTKGWNLCVAWESMYFYERGRKLFDSILRIGLNFILVYTMLLPSLQLYTFVVVAIMGGYLLYLYVQTKGKSLPWERLIEQEQRRMTLFYRVANMFTDVPHMKGRVKRRKWLDVFARGITFSQKETYSYLYVRTLLRSGDYVGVYIRLVAVGIILLVVVPNQYVQITISVLFVYLISFQLQTLWYHHRHVIWLSLYPVEEVRKQEALLRLMWKAMLIVSILFASTIMVATSIVLGVVAGACNLMFGYMYTYLYVKKKTKPLV